MAFYCQEFKRIIYLLTYLLKYEIMILWTIIIIIIIIYKFQRNASLEQNFRAAMCHVLHYSCNVNAAVADSLRCRMICGTVIFSHTKKAKWQ